ncbi:MAG TPA: mechanosensitive ion channel domain-containing protein [Stellaceae bacterium]
MRALALAAMVAFALTGPVWGQSAASAPNAAAALTAAAAQTAKPADQAGTTADLQNLVNTLQDDKQRAALINQLRTLIAAQTATAAAQPAGVETGAQGIVEGLAAHFRTIGQELIDIVGIARAAPHGTHWIAAQVGSPEARAAWIGALARLAVAFAAGAAVWYLLGRLLRPVRARLGRRNAERLPTWLALLVTTLVLTLIPIAAFAAVATLVLAILHPALPAQRAGAAAIGAIFDAQALLAVAWTALLSPARPYFLRLGEESRSYLYIWVRRFVLWAVYGFAAAAIVRALDAPLSVHDLILRLATVALAGLAVVFVLQNQHAVAEFLRGSPDEARPGGVFRAIRLALADTWHILAIVYILGSFGSYLVDLHGGVGFVLRATLASIAVLIGAGLATRFVHHLNRRGFELTAEMRFRYPGLQARANRYLPALIFAVSALIYILAIVLLLQAWGSDAIGWFELQSVRRVFGGLLSIGVVVVIAIAIWELINAAVERTLAGGNVVRHAQVGARMRTLLPLARTTVLIAIVTMVSFIVLSQLGVDIAPLLAGAGIIGIAIGLGSQQLVRDIINGLFILVENTVTVGDWVDVGGGHAGRVEELSIRSMTLRDGSGALHTVPFSAVAAVVNTNRGIGNAAIGVTVALGQDIDRAERLLGEIAADMRKEPQYKFVMLSELQYWGVDKVDGSSVTLVGQIVCTDGGRWPVQREFNRRVAQRFAAEGIVLAVPTQNLVVQEPRSDRRADQPQVTPFRAPRERG